MGGTHRVDVAGESGEEFCEKVDREKEDRKQKHFDARCLDVGGGFFEMESPVHCVCDKGDGDGDNGAHRGAQAPSSRGCYSSGGGDPIAAFFYRRARHTVGNLSRLVGRLMVIGIGGGQGKDDGKHELGQEAKNCKEVLEARMNADATTLFNRLDLDGETQKVPHEFFDLFAIDAGRVLDEVSSLVVGVCVDVLNPIEYGLLWNECHLRTAVRRFFFQFLNEDSRNTYRIHRIQQKT